MTFSPLSPPPGINSDDTTFAAEGRWVDGSNVRFRLGRPETIGGYTLQYGGLIGPVRNFVRLASSGSYKAGTTTKLYSDTNDVTPSPAPTAAAWALQPWGSTLLACPSGGKLYEQSGSAQATEVAQAPDQITWMLVTPQRQVLALGCNEEASDTFNGLCIRGSDLEDYTDWTTTSANNAFEHILDSGGSIRGGMVVGNHIVVFTEDVLYLGQFLGDPGQSYRFEPVADGCQLANPNAAATLGGYVYFVGPDIQLKRWAPGMLPMDIPCPLLRDARTSVYDRITVGANARFNEVWILYADPEDAGSENTRYIAYSVGESVEGPVWFKGQLARTAIVDTGLSSPTNSAFWMGDAAGNVYEHDRRAGGTLPAWHIQSADQTLGNGSRRMKLRGIRPDFEEQTGSISLTLYVRDNPQAAATTKGPYTLAGAAAKKDFRASGKYVEIKFSGAEGTSMRLGKPLFDIIQMGER